MILIGLYLSKSEWLTVVETLMKADDTAFKTAQHILDEIGFSLDIAPQYFAPRRDTCAICKNRKFCTVAAALPLCSDFVRKD